VILAVPSEAACSAGADYSGIFAFGQDDVAAVAAGAVFQLVEDLHGQLT
jgi:hypothetical protein